MVTYSQYSDSELASLLKEGDRAAFVEIYDRYYALLYIYTYKKLNNREESRDVIQEVFIALWNKYNSFELSTSLSAYLYSAVRNRAMNIFARRKIESKYMASLEDFLEKNHAEADLHVREDEIALLIEKEIAALPPRMREIFELSRKECLTYKEIAEKLDISEHTVSTQIKRALKVLRVKLGLFVFILLYLNL